MPCRCHLGPHQESSAQASKTDELGGDDKETDEPIINRYMVVELSYDGSIGQVTPSLVTPLL